MKRFGTMPKYFVAFILSLVLAAPLVACGSSGNEAPEGGSDVPEAGQVETGEGNGNGSGQEAGSEPVVQEESPFTEEQVSTGQFDLTMIRQSIVGSDQICAVAMMGYAQGDLEEFLGSVVFDYPVVATVSSDRWIEAGGDEVYLVVPRDEGASVAVNEWTVSPDATTGPYEGEAGEVLYRSEAGEALILRGNASDYLPNMQVSIVGEDGASLTYLPFCTLFDGSLDIPSGSPSVFDITVYDTGRVMPDDCAGEWSTFFEYLEDGTDAACALTVGEDGSLEYLWGPCAETGGAYENYYEGRWYISPQAGKGGLPSEAVVFELTLTEGTAQAPKTLSGTFCFINYADYPDYLYLCHLGGDPLIYSQGANGSIEFTMSVG